MDRAVSRHREGQHDARDDVGQQASSLLAAYFAGSEETKKRAQARLTRLGVVDFKNLGNGKCDVIFRTKEMKDVTVTLDVNVNQR